MTGAGAAQTAGAGPMYSTTSASVDGGHDREGIELPVAVAKKVRQRVETQAPSTPVLVPARRKTLLKRHGTAHCPQCVGSN